MFFLVGCRTSNTAASLVLVGAPTALYPARRTVGCVDSITGSKAMQPRRVFRAIGSWCVSRRISGSIERDAMGLFRFTIKSMLTRRSRRKFSDIEKVGITIELFNDSCQASFVVPGNLISRWCTSRWSQRFARDNTLLILRQLPCERALTMKSLRDSDQEYKNFMGSETLPSPCYILSVESSIPFYSTSNGYN